MKKCGYRNGLALLLCALLVTGTFSGCEKSGAIQITAGEQKPILTEKERTIQEKMDNMSLEEKVGQFFVLALRQTSSGEDMTVLDETGKETLRQIQPGGVILFAENLDTEEQTVALMAQMQEEMETPLFFGIDEEGGTVSRLDHSQIVHETVESAGEMEEDPQRAKAAGEKIGQVLQRLGIQVDFAPIADVNTNPDNPVIGIRSYSSDPQTAGRMACAFLEGLETYGISGAAKHFPGHGDTQTDSHDGSVSIDQTKEELETVELEPFRQLITAGIDFVMVGHIETPHVTGNELPASLSKTMVTDILRREMGFEGLVITDAMDMGAIVEEYPAGEASVLAIEAGVDLVLIPENPQEAFDAVCDAVHSGRISMERLDESVERILSFKYEKGILS